MAQENKKVPQRPMGPGQKGAVPHEKAKNFKSSMAKLLKFINPYKVLIIVAMIFAVAGTVFHIVGPKIIEKINKLIISGIPSLANPTAKINLTKVSTIGVWLIIIYLVGALFTYLQHYIMAGVTAKLTRTLRSNISQKINKLPLKYFDKQSYGDVLSRVTNDVDTIDFTLNNSLASMITSITTIIGVVIMMFTISWQLTLIILVSVPVSFMLVLLVVKLSQKYFIKQQKALGEINGHIEEIYSAHNVVKVFNGEDKANEKFDQINKELYKNSFKAQFLSGFMMPAMNFIGNLSYILICVIGGGIALGDVTFIASISAFVAYIKQFNQPLQQIANIASTLQSTAAAAERVFEFLDEEEQPDESNKTLTIKQVKGRVEFKDVCFGYNPSKEIIHNFNCVAKPGQKIAIVGPTGAGKTTMVNLLMRFYEVNSGQITIDGVDTKDMNRQYVRSLFGMVLQDTWLFEGTIKENLTYGNPKATDEMIKEACKSANVDHFIESLPGGYNMVLSENTALSQGQKQLMTIARAMIQNSPMLILDEATSSVDTRTEELIQKAMDKLMAGRTSFVIAHRLSTIKNADLILVMKNGNVIESGTHKQLIAQEGFYADLYNSQFTNKHAAVIE